METKKQTAVEWLLEEWPILESQIPPRIIDQAKAIEKEQIIESWEYGDKHEPWIIGRKTGEQYYNETYGGDK